MDLIISPHSTIPIYQQLREGITTAIAHGELPTGTKLDPVRTVAKSFGINPATVAKAYELLREDGLITTNSRLGSIVSPSVPREEDSFMHDLRTVLTRALAQGRSHQDIIALTHELLEENSPHSLIES